MKENIRLLVTGSRDFGILPNKTYDPKWVEFVKSFLVSFKDVEVLIQGGARGADSIARSVGLDLWGPKRVRTYYAKWKELGFGAGPVRNTEMLEQGKPNRVLAFFSDFRASSGTADMVFKAVKLDLPVRCYNKATNTHFYATRACKRPNKLEDLCNPEVDVVPLSKVLEGEY